MPMKIQLVIVFLIIHFYFLSSQKQYNSDNNADINKNVTRYFHLPVQEFLQQQIYLSVNELNDIVITHSSVSSSSKQFPRLHPGDVITHTDGIRILSGSLNEFLVSGAREVVVPVIDDNDIKNNGNKLLGFVLIQPFVPRKISARRGEFEFDFNEGNDNMITFHLDTSKPIYNPPPLGGGSCINDRDCYYNKGNCVFSKCNCTTEGYTGSYCQIYRPQYEIDMMLKEHKDRLINLKAYDKSQEEILKNAMKNNNNKKVDKDLYIKREDIINPFIHRTIDEYGEQSPVTNIINEAWTDSKLKDVIDSKKSDVNVLDSKKIKIDNTEHDSKTNNIRDSSIKEINPDTKSMNSDTYLLDSEKVNVLNTEQNNIINNFKDPNIEEIANIVDDNEQSQSKPKPKPRKRKPAPKQTDNIQNIEIRNGDTLNDNNEEQKNVLTMADLYGLDKPYPEPFLAGKLSRPEFLERQKLRASQQSFKYSVRFRTGPIGISFDNKLLNETKVEKVIVGQQAEQSDVKAGDYLIAINTVNTTSAPAKISLRIISTLEWPIVLVFESLRHVVSTTVIKEKFQEKLVNISIFYPPTLMNEIQAKVAEWTPSIDSEKETCSFYLFTTPQDPFGCNLQSHESQLPYEITNVIDRFDNLTYNDVTTLLSNDIKSKYPMLSLLLQNIKLKNIPIDLKISIVSKRGVCTFVEKAKILTNILTEDNVNINQTLKNVGFGLMVNNDNTLTDLPSGKESTNTCNIPFAVARENEASLIHLSAITNEVLGFVYSSSTGLTSHCVRVQSLVDELLDLWPHTVPYLSIDQLSEENSPVMSEIRRLSEDGGRLALSGENGWVFFDYLQAMFGPQEVPLGPYKLQMAYPPYGCDPAAYTVRIQSTIVAILRGGGCTFGSKVIHAQKLGALAVIIVDTVNIKDPKAKLSRLQALPDEESLIKIPCIMVSNRIKWYLEEGLKKYKYLTDNHIVSIQPMIYKSNYDGLLK